MGKSVFTTMSNASTVNCLKYVSYWLLDKSSYVFLTQYTY